MLRAQGKPSKTEWMTPIEMGTALKLEFSFELDVASSKQARRYSGEVFGGEWLGPDHPNEAYRDGLADVDWTDVAAESPTWRQPAIWMNPPYSRGNRSKGIQSSPLEPWLKRAKHCSDLGVPVVALLPFAPETHWWRTLVVPHVDQIRMFTHRVAFVDPATETPASGNDANHALCIYRNTPGLVAPVAPQWLYWEYLGGR
jgi:hypothetical protein